MLGERRIWPTRGRQVDLQHRIGQRGEPGRCPPLAFRIDLAAPCGDSSLGHRLAKDSSGATGASYRGKSTLPAPTPRLRSQPTTPSLSPTAGRHTFSVTLRTVGTWSLTATDTATASISGSQSGIVVTAIPATTYTPISPRRVLDTRPTSGRPTSTSA